MIRKFLISLSNAAGDAPRKLLEHWGGNRVRCCGECLAWWSFVLFDSAALLLFERSPPDGETWNKELELD